jgi:hypothetical protein
MIKIGSAITDRIISMLRADNGIRHVLRLVAEAQGQEIQPFMGDVQMSTANISVELLDRNTGSKYPQINVYCEKFVNSQRERFRAFSGTAQAVIEVRVSHDRLEQLDQQLNTHVESIIHLMQQSRGNWGAGLHYSGTFEVIFSPIKPGGKHFIRAARVQLPIEVSID